MSTRSTRTPSSAPFSGIFEHSPWVARTAFARRPFRGLADVHLAFEEAVRNASAERRLALVRAHPELAGARPRRAR